MSDFGDRLIILVIAGTGLAGAVGWLGGILVAEFTGWPEFWVGVTLAGAFLLLLAGLWYGFGRTEETSGRRTEL